MDCMSNQPISILLAMLVISNNTDWTSKSNILDSQVL